MRRHYLLALMLPLLVAASAHRAKPHPDPSAAFIAAARAAVADGLKDPAAAQFRNLSAVTDGAGLRKVCGEVNAKNSYGGYIGFQAFAYAPGIGTVLAPEADDKSDEANAANRAGSGCPGFWTWHN